MKDVTKLWLLLFLLPCCALADTHFVWTNSPSPTPPYTNWSGAAWTIQEAIDAGSFGDTILVTNGVYEVGGRVVYGTGTNRVALTNSVSVVSVNGPEVTIIKGNGPPGPLAVRCAYVGENCQLSGFSLTNGSNRASGDWFIRRAFIAALTEEGQSQEARAESVTRGCVKITATGDVVTFETSISRFACHYELGVRDGVVVAEDGETCVPAREFKKACSKLIPGCDAITLSHVPNPPGTAEPSTEQTSETPADGMVGIGAMRANMFLANVRIKW